MSLRHSLIVAATLALPVPVIAGSAWSQSAPPTGSKSIKTQIVGQSDGPWRDATTVIATVQLPPGGQIERHTQPGDERLYVESGRGELNVDGDPVRTMAAGEAAYIPFGKAHSFTNGNGETRLLSTLIVEKGKPLAAYLEESARPALNQTAATGNATRVYE
jgi:quercetin dioxygenase-like cupin family protein